ncbi:MAG TPA: cytochrome c family protein [Xanthobacteraceae bacterium]|nr:cytochrome c family protein [Xanthobacteraceae bacterium]
MRRTTAGAAPVFSFTIVALGAMAAMLGSSAAQAADVEHGKVVFQTCAACHSEKPDAIGPSLRGVYGRKSGSLDNFRYSNAMQRANLVWDEVNLRAYLKDPQAKVKGNRMPFAGLSDPKDIDDVIAFLKQYK